jgi:hypothetical protein
MIKLHKDCHKPAKFRAAHASAYDPKNEPDPIPAGAYPCGSDFFDEKTQEELQEIIDVTIKTMKKLVFSGGVIANAKDMLKNLGSDRKGSYTVRWGIHQSEGILDPKDGQVKHKHKHFTIIAMPADWHLYVATSGKRLSAMSDGPLNVTNISKP